jgi:hypothetical protein
MVWMSGERPVQSVTRARTRTRKETLPAASSKLPTSVIVPNVSLSMTQRRYTTPSLWGTVLSMSLSLLGE